MRRARQEAEEYAFDPLSSPIQPRLVKRRLDAGPVASAGASVLAAPGRPTRQPPHTHQRGDIKATYVSTLHNGTPFGGSCQACCYQFKLADRLFLSLYSRGRHHLGDLTVAFLTSPSDEAGGGRRCSYLDWRRSWGADVTVDREITIRSNEGPYVVDACGLIVTFTSYGRSHSASVMLLDAPVRMGCATCRVIDMPQAAESAAGLPEYPNLSISL